LGQTGNLEIPGSLISFAPRNDSFGIQLPRINSRSTPVTWIGL
jgi:hypothetical protein